MTEFWQDVLVALGLTAIAGGLLLSLPPGLILAERKICGWIQDRSGPNRVGPFGLLQPIADAIKLIFKEDFRPAGADKYLYTLGPVLVFVPSFLAFAAIPFGNAIEINGKTYDIQIGDMNVGILWLLAVSSLSVYGISFGGWASNNKFSLLGGLRAAAQLISYELAMGLSLVSLLMITSTLSPQEIVRQQAEGHWYVLSQPLACLIFLIAAFAETNRLPFDLPEAEPELIGGYHTEYSAMRWALFFFGEYLAMVGMSALFITLFMGGWSMPGLDPSDHSVIGAITSFVVFMVKLLAVLFFFIWVRWTLPRFRFDQLMALGWKVMVPVALLNIVITGVLNVSTSS